MKNEIQIFKNNQFGEVRAGGTSEQPLFCLVDICKAVSLTNPSSVKSRLDEEDTILIDLHALNSNEGTIIGNSMATFITESGFYDVLLQSSSPKVKPFRKWVTSEVLPSIRKTGGYRVPQTFSEALRLAAEQTEQIERQQKQIALLQPKAEFMDKVMDCDEKIDIGQAAKILELPFGRNTLFVKLRERGIFFKNRNEPKQEYMERGYFQLKEEWIKRDHHDGFIVLKVLVTQKGLSFISNLFHATPKEKQLAVIQ
jgi:prophage antirepressor-like protein